MFESCNRITLLCRSDYKKLTKLGPASDAKSIRYGEGHPKLDTATVVEDHLFPDGITRIGTVVSLKDLGTGSITRLMLSDSGDKHRETAELRIVSVTSSLGIALLGARIGEHIKWTLPNGHTRYLRVSELATQSAVC